MKLPGIDKLGSLGWVGERKALALLCLGFYTTLFFLIAMASRQEIPEWTPVFGAMTVVYLVAFWGLGAEWFWGRWFATGLGYWGCSMALMGFVSTRSLPAPLAVFGAMHGLIALCLMGEKMAAAFDAKPAWRERWHLDEQGVIRVRRSVTRAASSLPALIMFALAPREAAEVAVLALALLGLGGVLCRRSFGVLALGAAAIASLTTLFVVPELYFGATPTGAGLLSFAPIATFLAAPRLVAAFASLALFAAVAPFARGLHGYLTVRK